MAHYVQTNPVNKHRLLATKRPGFTCALLSAIRFHPEAADVDLLLRIDPAALPPVFILHKLVDAMEALQKATLLNKVQSESLRKWATGLKA
jgi:hypothetical protein